MNYRVALTRLKRNGDTSNIHSTLALADGILDQTKGVTFFCESSEETMTLLFLLNLVRRDLDRDWQWKHVMTETEKR